MIPLNKTALSFLIRFLKGPGEIRLDKENEIKD